MMIQRRATAGVVIIIVLASANVRAQTTQRTSSSIAPTQLLLCRKWAVSAENGQTGGLRIVFTLIGSGQMPKFPILMLSYCNKKWTAILSCGERLEGDRRAPLLLQWDSRETELARWRRAPDNGVAFPREPLSFIQRLLSCHDS